MRDITGKIITPAMRLLSTLVSLTAASYAAALPISVVNDELTGLDTRTEHSHEVRTVENALEVRLDSSDVEHISTLLQKVSEGHPVPDELTGVIADALGKRDYPLLTTLFTQLNQSGAALPILKALCTSPLSQGTTIDAIEEYVKQKTLATILTAATKSGLAFDIVMLFFTDYNMVPGAIKIGKALYSSGVIHFKREDVEEELEKRGLGDKRSLIGDIFNIFGGNSGGNSGGSSGGSTTSQVGTTTPTTVGTTTPSTIGTVVGTTGSSVPNLGTYGQVGSSPATSAYYATNSASVPTAASSSNPTGNAANPFANLFGTAKASSAGPTSSSSAKATSSPTAASSSSLSSGGLLGGLLGGLFGTVTGAINNIVGGTTQTIGDTIGDLSQGNIGGALNSSLQGTLNTITSTVGGSVSSLDSVFTNTLSGAQQSIVAAVVSLIKNVGDLEEICESLEKSGLGVSVVRFIFTDSDMQTFAVKLVTQMVKDGVISLSILLDAASQSGVVISVLTSIITSPSALSTIFAYFVWLASNFTSVF